MSFITFMVKLGAAKFSLKQGYFRANKVLLLLVVLMFIYPIFNDLFHLKVACQFEMIYNKPCKSCGLTRGVRECFYGNFKEAILLNKQSIFLFTAFIFQITFRICVFICGNWVNLSDKFVRVLIVTDLTILIILFITNKMIYG